MVWYRSAVTHKVISESASQVIDNIFGPGTFQNYIAEGTLVKLENPSVIDVLRDTHSTKLATLRYQQIHKCDQKEARAGVKSLKKDMGFNGRRQRRKRKNHGNRAV